MPGSVISIKSRKGKAMGLRDDDSSEEILAPLPSEVVDPDEYKALQIWEGTIVDSARLGSRIYIGVKAVCQYLGIQSNGQITKIRSKHTLAQGIKMMRVETAGGPQTTLFLDFDVFPLWLLDIHPKKTRPEFQQTIFDIQIKISQIVRDVYYAYILAQSNPDYAYIIQLLEQVLDEVRSATQDSGEMGHAITMMLQMLGKQHTEPALLPAPHSRPPLRIVAAGHNAEIVASPSATQMLLRDRHRQGLDVALQFDNQTGQVMFIGADGQQTVLSVDQALQALSHLQEQRNWLLQQYYDQTSHRE